MENSTKKCCICLEIAPNSHQITETDENNRSAASKLRACVSEIDWKDDYTICTACNTDLMLFYQFREKCLQSETVRNQSEDSDSETIVIIETVDDSEPNEEPETPNSAKSTRRFVCEECDEVYWSSIKLVAHMVKEHNFEARNVRPFPCKVCGRKFRSSSNLVQHSKFHKREKNYVCSYCSKSYVMKRDLIDHEKVHLNQREYKCDICFKGFNGYKDIRSHKLCVHTDPSLWKYVCQVCEKRFPIKANCDLHVKRHTDERPFECHLCQRKFLDKFTLRRHFLAHSDHRAHLCNLCDKEYKTKRDLGVHQKNIHGIGNTKLPSKEKKYLCHMCSKCFRANNQLNRHLLTHSGEKPHFCTICNKRYFDKSYIKSHMLKVHNVVVKNE